MSIQRSLNSGLRFRFGLVLQVDRRTPDDPGHALLAMDPDPLTDRDGTVVAADGLEVQQAFVIEVMDDEADLVHVPGQHDPRAGLGIEDRRDIAVDVGRDAVCDALGVGPIGPCRGLLVAARRGRVDDGFQEVE